MNIIKKITALKTDGSLWEVWRERAQTASSAEYREFAFERKMEKVHAAWVNPVYNTQTYVLGIGRALWLWGKCTGTAWRGL